MRLMAMFTVGAVVVAGCSSSSNSITSPTQTTTAAATGAATTVTTSAATVADPSTAPATTPPSAAITAVASTTTIASAVTAVQPTVAPTTVPPTPTTAPVSRADAPGNWFTFDGDNSRRGIAAAGPDPATVRKTWTSPALDGAVYGQALVEDQTVFAATEADSVVALSAADGHILWNTNLGQPVPMSMLPCGNIDPTGITSTPVLDPSGKVIYVAAFVLPGVHILAALDTATGAVQWQHPIDPPALSPLVEQQRGALTLANGRVYVPFGGLYGDCGDYKGAIVSIAADGSGDTASWVTPTEREGAVWAPPGFSVDASGNLFVAIGNAASTDPNNFDYGNSVVRLTPDLQLADYWAPKDWAALSADDKDLGSQAPIPVDATHLFVAGKSGVGYIVSATALGGIGAQVSQARLCAGEAFGGAASNGSIVVLGCSAGPVGAAVDGNGVLTKAWTVNGTTSGAPVIVGNAAWFTSRNGLTQAFDVSSGAKLASVRIAGALIGFPGTTVTPTAIYVTGTNSVTALAAA